MTYSSMEPLMPVDTRHELADLATDLVAKANALAGRLHPSLRAELGNLVRSMNCCYSNLIAGTRQAMSRQRDGKSHSSHWGMHASPVSSRRHRFPPQIIAHAVWLYFRFPLSLRLVEEMLLERGIIASCETIRRRAMKFEITKGGMDGGADEIRTHDLCSAIAALSQLSYSPAPRRSLRRRGGVCQCAPARFPRLRLARDRRAR